VTLWPLDGERQFPAEFQRVIRIRVDALAAERTGQMTVSPNERLPGVEGEVLRRQVAWTSPIYPIIARKLSVTLSS
jgi:hypothetical protein